MQTRDNEMMERAVAHGVNMDAMHGAAVAWAYMASAEVPRQVILRVLAAPTRRRPGDVVEPTHGDGRLSDNLRLSGLLD